MSHPFERIRAKALGGEKIDGDVYELKAACEAKLSEPHKQLQTCCNIAQSLRLALPVQGDHLPAQSVDVTGLLMQARQTQLQHSSDLEFALRSKESLRMDRGLTRNPDKPDTVTGLLYSGLMILVEGGMNTSFLLNAHLLASPFAALLVSMLISATNVVASNCAGYFIGRWRHLGAYQGDPDTRLLKRQQKAHLQFYGYLCCMALFHISVGLVRAQETLDQVTHSLFAYQQMLITPESIFLVFIGVCTSCIAYYHGLHSFNDSYPGYGRRGKAIADQIGEIADTYDAFADEIEARFNEAIETSCDADTDTLANINAYNKAVENCQSAHLKLTASVVEAESTFKAEIAQIISAYESAKGRRNPQLADQLHGLASFQSYLNISLPALYPLPDYSDQVSHLRTQKADALERLAVIFQNNPDEGETT